MSDYGVKDIKTLEGIEAIRLRPGITPFKHNLLSEEKLWNSFYGQ